MAYTTIDATVTLNNYLGISDGDKRFIKETKNRGFVMQLGSGEDVVVFTYPLVHKQDNTKNYFDSRDSGAKERQIAWQYALLHRMKYFCLGVNSAVDKYEDYVFSLECDERAVEILSGTKNGERNGPGNQIIIPNDYVPSKNYERIQNRLGISISVIHRSILREYMDLFDNRPYLDKYNNDVLVAASKPTLPVTDFMAVDPEEQKKRFRAWMEKQVKPEGDSDAGQLYSKNTIDQYISNLDNTFYEDEKSLFATADIEVVKKCAAALDAAEKKNNTQRSAVQKYIAFLRSSMTIRFETGYRVDKNILDVAMNRILFGAPGTGKSYKINEDKGKLLGEDNETDYERVTFHPDYSYANFVGTYKPVPTKTKDAHGNEVDAITYEFVPGPFMRVYVNALMSGRTENPKPYLLIIEEINRANVAAVFGDIFQLLDRGGNNVSEYPIQASEDIKKYLADKLGGDPELYAKIRIPDNMFIWATMNSADQGVFPMDTAFKRRWDFTYIGINENDKELKGKYVLLADNQSQKVEWNTLRKLINRYMAQKGVNEDKQLGPYFISKNIVVPESGDEINRDDFIRVFKNKVIMYLFEDVFRGQKRDEFFEGCFDNKYWYSGVCAEFEKKGFGIFNNEIVTKMDKEIEKQSLKASDAE